MIKNILYSLFLHFLLLSLIYISFNVKNIDENKSSEIAVSLVALSGDENSSKTKPVQEKAKEVEEKKPEVIKEKTESVKPAESKKVSVKDKVKEAPKKLAKAKPAKTIAKPVEVAKTPDFKQPEKQEKKQDEESNKAKNNPVKNEHQDEKQNKTFKKDQDLGLKKKSEKDEEIEEQSKAAQVEEDEEMANNLENIDLSVREKFNIQSQLKRCYKRACDENKIKSKLKISVQVTISQDGYIDSDLKETLDAKRYSNSKDAEYKVSIDNVARALELCSPLRNLPIDKYEIWKEALLEFGEDDVN